jgi:hypothetical protein
MFDELDLLIELEKEAAMEKVAGGFGQFMRRWWPAFVAGAGGLGLGGLGGYLLGRRRAAAMGGLEPYALPDLSYFIGEEGFEW